MNIPYTINEIKRNRIRIKIVNFIESLDDGKKGINCIGFYYKNKPIYQISFNYYENNYDIDVNIKAMTSLLGEVLTEEEIIKLIELKHNYIKW